MKKTIKGALAAAAGGVLLLGGAGSLAYWTNSATLPAGSATSGFMTLTAGACGPNWVYANGSNVGATVVHFVPGDQISKACTFTIGASGDNLQFSPTIPSTVAITPTPAAPTFMATVAATYALPSGPLAATDKLTQANNGNVLTATIKVTFPYGNATTVNANDTENVTAALDNLTVTLTQNLSTANPNA